MSVVVNKTFSQDQDMLWTKHTTGLSYKLLSAQTSF